MSYTYKYPHPAVTTDCVIFTFHEDRLKLLLIKRGIEPYRGHWALPGGFLRIDESAEQCAYRELEEETGVTGCTIKQFHTFSDPTRDPRERVITIAFYALMKWQKATGADDAEFADWIPADSLPPLAFDHEIIVRHAMAAIRRDIYFEPVGFELLNDIFTMPELQKVYEAILGREFDRRNFAKKMKHLDILEEVTEQKYLPAVAREDIKFEKESENTVPANSAEVTRCQSDMSLPEFTQDDEYHLSEFRQHDEFHLPEFMQHDDFSLPESSMPPQSKPKSRRKGLLFRLNKLRYKTLKDNDEFEF